MSRSLTRTTSFACTPERLWRALTDPRELSGWMLSGDLAAVAGHRCVLSGIGPSGQHERIQCEVLAVEAGRRLSMRWRLQGQAQPAFVDWIIVPRRGRTLLRIVHREASERISDAGARAERADAGLESGGLDALADIAGLAALHAHLADAAPAMLAA